ncbi:maltokinase N-terminal cap-like domain-containing protein [Streptomyces mangrovisoli]|uniref:1,4-alpha-glucan branching protein n=1 Tax=Streptomyces mangrovisoli TaxID=1428628 RepID=A0A1J4NVN9_9ACTN|nr:1,4-alpha-glucan-branching protein [Streptomyces mangrovisoli]OIJ65230.1 1,4-alpha-glucan branching protein [Streptomyces mangrovisoli]
MAIIHHTTLSPTKLELLAEWLPGRPWYAGGDRAPELSKAGGFRLDDPDGEVGIEFMVAVDASGALPVSYLVPLTYRGAPLDGAESALVGTMEHGVLGKRWAYDGTHDPVLLAQLHALFAGRAVPQMQSVTDTPDPSVAVESAPGAADAPTGPAAEPRSALHFNRVLEPSAPAPDGALGQVVAGWTLPDGTEQRAVLLALLPTVP